MLRIAALLLPTLLIASEAAPYPLRTLERDGTAITVAMPDAAAGYYRGPRFDWGGLVIGLKSQGHELFTDLKPHRDPTQHDHAAGACEEFGMDGMPGYEAVPVGGRLLKIGVGALTRDTDKPYFFAHPYPIAQAGTWTVAEVPDGLSFTQEFALDAGQAYRYEKAVTVAADGFTIARRLTNRGTARIATDHYGHNMIALDHQPIDGTWSLRLAWPATADKPAPSFAFTDGLLTLTGPLKSTLWTPFSWAAAPAVTGFTLAHAGSGIALTATTDAPPSAFRLYGESRALCPEPFTAIDIAPGASFAWTTRYTVTRSTAP